MADMEAVVERDLKLQVVDGRRSRMRRAMCITAVCCGVFVVVLGAGALVLKWQLSSLEHSNAGNATIDISDCSDSIYDGVLPRDFQVPKIYQAGWAKDKSALWIMEVGSHDVAGQIALNETYGDLILEVYAQLTRQIMCSVASNPKLGGANGTWASIVDMGGYGFSQISAAGVMKEVAAGWAPLFDTNSFSIGTEVSWVARGLFRILGPVLGESLAKFEMFGDKSDYLPEILKRVDKDQLPEKFGGNPGYTCRTPYCRTYNSA